MIEIKFVMKTEISLFLQLQLDSKKFSMRFQVNSVLSDCKYLLWQKFSATHAWFRKKSWNEIVENFIKDTSSREQCC